MLTNGARRKNAISFTFFNPYQTSSTENVRNCIFRLNKWKLSLSLRKSCSVFMFFGGTSTSQKCQVFLAPKNVSLEIQKLFSRQKLYSFNSRFTGVIRLKIVWKIREILQFHNKCITHIGSHSFHPLEDSNANQCKLAGKLGFFEKMTHKTWKWRKIYH